MYRLELSLARSRPLRHVVAIILSLPLPPSRPPLSPLTKQALLGGCNTCNGEGLFWLAAVRCARRSSLLLSSLISLRVGLLRPPFLSLRLPCQGTEREQRSRKKGSLEGERSVRPRRHFLATRTTERTGQPESPSYLSSLDRLPSLPPSLAFPVCRCRCRFAAAIHRHHRHCRRRRRRSLRQSGDAAPRPPLPPRSESGLPFQQGRHGMQGCDDLFIVEHEPAECGGR